MTGSRVPEEMLLAYATGALNEPLSLVVASHMALNPQSRAEVEGYETVGGALLEQLEPKALADGALERTLSLIDLIPDEDRTAVGQICAPVKPQPVDGLALPSVLRDYIGPDIEALAWKPVLRGVEEADLTMGSEGARTRLMRIAPGAGAPRHTHGGLEVTLVLDGAYRDVSGRYGRGDVQVADDALEHAPVAEADGLCLCLVVSDAPIRLTGFFGRLFNPFIRH
ncbi:ChrR family anti-sigma-E factor [Algihabitans albus]|uniref:ChrR family anti-sigma-E factor n=1 Tax=Algihabitans albus TaxID=2164067 RepID=UPI000E5CF830|nr:ChrR family anti-sigma-E factor [Algihabitans albus]